MGIKLREGIELLCLFYFSIYRYLTFDYKRFFLKGLKFENVPFDNALDEEELKPPKEIPTYMPSVKSSESEESM